MSLVGHRINVHNKLNRTLWAACTMAQSSPHVSKFGFPAHFTFQPPQKNYKYRLYSLFGAKTNAGNWSAESQCRQQQLSVLFFCFFSSSLKQQWCRLTSSIKMKFSDHAAMSTAVQMLFSGCTASECVKKEAEVGVGGEVWGEGGGRMPPLSPRRRSPHLSEAQFIAAVWSARLRLPSLYLHQLAHKL